MKRPYLTKHKLGELIEVTRGASLSGEYYAEEGKLVRLTLGNFDLNGGGFKLNTSKTDLYFTGPVKENFILSKGDIITPLTEQTIGLLGATARIPESGKYIQSQDVALIRCKEGLLYPNYCYYLISSKMVRNQLSAAAQQTKIRHTSPDRIKDCTVCIPSYEEQIRIGDLLVEIDEKINLNKSINHNLEAMAKQLYDYWFVQFDFPNAEGKPYKSSGGKMVWNEKLKREIPEGWCVSTIADLMPIITGKEDANFSVPNGKYKFFTCSKEVLNCNDAVFHGDAVLLSGNGDIHTKYYSGDFNAYQRTYVLIAETPLYFAATYFVCTNEIQRLLQGTSGSIIKFITKGMIERIPVLITDRIELYERLNLLLKQCLLNKSEIESLTKQRDELLPLLMNGQVSLNYDLSVVALLWRTPSPSCRLSAIVDMPEGGGSALPCGSDRAALPW